jgi:UPF0755 protein
MTRALRLFAGGLVLLLALAGGWLFHFLQAPVAPPAPALITVPPGESFASVAERLVAQNVVAAELPFHLLARWRGEARKVQAGRYEFAEPATPGEVLQRLVAGDVIRTRVTIPEGLTVAEIAVRLEAAGLAPRKTVLELAMDPAFTRSQGIAAETLEGYLFPETYSLAVGTTPEKILAAMVREFQRRLTPELQAAAAARNLTVHQLVTLASIMQKEAGNNEELPLIAAVFHNRISRGMPLQADPTVIYGIPDFAGNLTRKHLTTSTPYNTYRFVGLPPGPIANPGAEALQAAVQPAPVPYLFFVARGDGTHVFSETLKEHNQAVRRYQLRGAPLAAPAPVPETTAPAQPDHQESPAPAEGD